MIVKVKAGLSAVLGFFFGLITYLLLSYLELDGAFKIGVICGIGFYLALLIFLYVYEEKMNKKYAEFEKDITSPIFYNTNGNFNLGNGKIKNGNIYFCENGIVCVCLEEKPYTLDEILLQDIDRYQYDNVHLNIYTKDGRVFVVTVPDVAKIIEILQEKKWVI